ncbi:hypothetical protein E6C76_13370 [Pseudothauera nasutitermitis]|uniref:MSHA biogenesis protein MshI n=1 Tax=Pseudothauera nasutitermitis TaxID=2565930 RepID=A0A4S4AY86_9RHOO|nr:hypothetical protein [Pseudothauera nasutitermitis]THF63582.1 hypothetical protein E6C76_13370 [Pseudothauera nasutitermitis]
MSAVARQQINLLQAELQERKTVLPATQLLAIVGIAALLAVVLSVAANWRAQAARAEVARLQSEATQREAVVTVLQTELEARSPDPALTREANRLERQLRHLRRVVELAQPQPATPLSGYLAGLGRQRQEGLWLTGITLANRGRDVELDGRTLSPDLLPAYLAALGQEPAFSGLAFGDLKLERSADEPRWLAFRIAAGCLAADKDCLTRAEARP